MAESLLAVAVRLTSAAEALAALAAAGRVDSEGLDVPEAVARLLRDVSVELTGGTDFATDPATPQAIGMATAFLRESIALVEDPARIGGWSTTDPGVLQGVGRLSMSIAPVIADAARQLGGLSDALTAPGASLLDVGTGCGWLAIALARTFPTAQVTGIDIFEPALALARTNIASESGGERVEILHCDVTEFEAPGRFDAVWLPLPFLPEPIVPEAIQRCTQSLKPGGWLLPGTFAGPSDRLANLLTELRIVRSGGHPWTTDEMVAMLADAGLAKASELTSTWPAPVRMFAAQQA